MRHVPSATSLSGTRLLAFARLWFSPAIVAGVFEPLVADWQREAQAARIRSSANWINFRWRIAFVANGIMALPRSVAVPLPAGLVVDLTLRAILFGTLGFMWQQTLTRGFEVAGAAAINSLPFALLPVVMRLRSDTDTPDHAARSLTLVGATAVAIILALLAGPSWSARAGAAAIPLVVALMGWRLGALRPPWWTGYSPLLRWWLILAMVASTWGLAVYPLKLALGMPMLDRFWGSNVEYGLALLLSTLIQADQWRERRRRV